MRGLGLPDLGSTHARPSLQSREDACRAFGQYEQLEVLRSGRCWQDENRQIGSKTSNAKPVLLVNGCRATEVLWPDVSQWFAAPGTIAGASPDGGFTCTARTGSSPPGWSSGSTFATSGGTCRAASAWRACTRPRLTAARRPGYVRLGCGIRDRGCAWRLSVAASTAQVRSS